MLAIYVRPLAFATDLISNCAKTRTLRTATCMADGDEWEAGVDGNRKWRLDQ
jgi:hypothetical protein